MRTESSIVVPPFARSAPVPGPASAPHGDPQCALVDAIENPAVLIEQDGRVRAANRAATATFGRGGLYEVRCGRLEPAVPGRLDAWRRLLDEALHAGRVDGELAADPSPVPVRIVHLGGLRLLVIMPSARQPVSAPDPVERLAAGAGLTHSEVAVLRALLAGQSVRAIAAARATSEATVRSQVRALLWKTGTSSIRHLLLSVLAPPLRPAPLTTDAAGRGGARCDPCRPSGTPPWSGP
jgi:DNA-binding CsgD family transcriptional regulator